MRADTPLADVVVKMTANKHRLAVSDENGEIVNVISQMDMVRFLTQCRDFVETLDIPISEYRGIVGKEVVSVHKDTSLINALLSCFENKVTGTAIVDDSGKIIGNLSTSDLVHITDENVSLLGLSIHHYLIYEGKVMRVYY